MGWRVLFLEHQQPGTHHRSVATRWPARGEDGGRGGRREEEGGKRQEGARTDGRTARGRAREEQRGGGGMEMELKTPPAAERKPATRCGSSARLLVDPPGRHGEQDCTPCQRAADRQRNAARRIGVRSWPHSMTGPARNMATERLRRLAGVAARTSVDDHHVLRCLRHEAFRVPEANLTANKVL